jgi:hypothetical protein
MFTGTLNGTTVSRPRRITVASPEAINWPSTTSMLLIVGTTRSRLVILTFASALGVPSVRNKQAG